MVPVCPCVELYEDEWWRDLPPDIQQLYGVLGYNEALWDGGIEEAPSDDLYWSELSAEEQKAALILGYTQEIWDADDVAFEASVIAKGYPERHILLKWTREDEHLWEPYGSASLNKVFGAINDDGEIFIGQMRLIRIHICQDHQI